MPSSTEPTFENALAQLEALIEKMESGKTPLHELVDKYEQGTHLLKTCQRHLKSAEMKIEKLKEDKELSLEPFALDS